MRIPEIEYSELVLGITFIGLKIIKTNSASSILLDSRSSSSDQHGLHEHLCVRRATPLSHVPLQLWPAHYHVLLYGCLCCLWHLSDNFPRRNKRQINGTRLDGCKKKQGSASSKGSPHIFEMHSF